MMSKAEDEARQRAQRLSAAKKRTAAQPEPVAAPKPTPAEQVRPVRVSVDLAPALFSELEDWTTRTGREIGRVRVGKSDVLRELARRLLADEELQQTVIERLRSQTRR